MAPRHPSNVLIVEDERLIAKDLQQTLETIGYKVCGMATSGNEAIRLIEELSPEIILMEIRLRGEMDGIETVKTIRKKWSIPVVYLTTPSESSTLERAMETEPFGYIVEPFRETELLCGIEVALERHRTEVAIREREEMFRCLSMVDELTGLYNRRGFYTLANDRLKIARRYGQHLVLIFSDVDGLKAVNDQFGHSAGDQALRDMSRLITHTFRSSDLIARLAGDEFSILTHATEETARLAVSRLKHNLVAFNSRTVRRFHLDVSVGSAVYDGEGGETLDGLLARADAAMYQAKRSRAGPPESGSSLT